MAFVIPRDFTISFRIIESSMTKSHPKYFDDPREIGNIRRIEEKFETRYVAPLYVPLETMRT